MSSADDAMSRYAAGHNQSFGQVYDAVAPRLEGYLRRHLRHATLIEDIIQQTFLQIHAARGTFITGAAVLPWAVAIARRLLIDSTRRKRREESLDDSLDSQFFGVTVAAAAVLANGEDTLTAHETEARLSSAYQHLTEPQRAAYELVTTEGLSHAEAAAVLGTTVTGVKLRVHRVTLALRASLEDPPATLTAGILAGAPPVRGGEVAGHEGDVCSVPPSRATLPAPTRGDPR